MRFSDSFHQKSKNRLAEKRPAENDAIETSEEWVTVHYKSYPRAKKIKLTGAKPSGEISSLIEQRKSERIFSKQPVTLDAVSALLRYSCGIQKRDENADQGDTYHRAQPSAGGRFPIEIYLANFVSGEIPSGIFHYDVREHQLDLLFMRQFTESDFSMLFTYPWVSKASCVLLLTGVFERNQVKYGERGYRQMLIESGHIGQNIGLVASALGLKSVMLGGTFDDSIEKLLDIDGITESLLYSVAIGSRGSVHK